MKFCQECGSSLLSASAKFCENCGFSLPDTLGNPSDTPLENEVQNSKNNIYNLGVKLEQMVEQILRKKGFETTRREKLKGRSGTHEIDITARRNNKLVAVECKNYGELRTIGIKEIRDFHDKIQDLPDVNDAIFVTNIEFSTGVYEYASHNNIELWNGDKLQRQFYLLNLGRLDGKEEVLVGTCLPNKIEYEEATKLSLVNPEMLIVSNVVLTFRPYYIFTYELNMKKGFLGRQTVRENGEFVMDAVSKKLIRHNNSHSNMELPKFFLSKDQKDDARNDLLNNIEYEYILEDINTIEPQKEYKISRTSNYAINKLDTKILKHVAERFAIEEIVEQKKVKHDEIKIKSYLLYIPKWLVIITSKENTYLREILSSSGRMLIDEIYLCPRDLSSKIRAQAKLTYAVCTICGKAFCKGHIYQNNEYFFCEKHNYRSSIQQVIKERSIESDDINTDKNMEESLENIHRDLESFLDSALHESPR